MMNYQQGGYTPNNQYGHPQQQNYVNPYSINNPNSAAAQYQMLQAQEEARKRAQQQYQQQMQQAQQFAAQQYQQQIQQFQAQQFAAQQAAMMGQNPQYMAPGIYPNNMGYMQPTPQSYTTQALANGMVGNNTSFGTPLNNVPVNAYNPAPQSRGGWAQTSQHKTYKSKTGTSLNNEIARHQQSYKPVTTQNHYGVVQNPVQNQINESNPQISQNLIERIGELEYQNTQLKETVEMLMKMLNKDSVYPHLIGKNEKKVTSEEKTIENNRVKYTLYGTEDGSEINTEFSVRPFTIKALTSEGRKLSFMVDPSDKLSTDIHDIINVGEEITKEIQTGKILSNRENDIFSHRVKVGQAIVSSGDSLVNENIKMTFNSFLGDNPSEEEIQNAAKRTAKEIEKEIKDKVLTPIKTTQGLVEKVKAIHAIESKIDINGLKYTTKDVISSIKYKLRVAYNEFVNNNLGFNEDPLTNLNPDEVEQVHNLLMGVTPNVHRTRESIHAYIMGLNDILADFSHGLELLQVNVDIDTEEEEYNVDYIIKLITTNDIYSYIPEDREFVEDIARHANTTHVVTAESNKKLFNILEAVLNHKREHRESIENKNINPAMFLSNLYLRVATIDNDVCSVFKVCKVIQSKKPIYIVKPVLNTL